MTAVSAKAPWHLYIVGVVALLFNAIGVFDFSMTMARGTAYLADAGATPEQVAIYQSMPVWMTIVWAIGVFGAFLGALLLLGRRRLALAFFSVSLAAYLLNLLYTHHLAVNAIPIDRPTAVLAAVIAGQLAALIGYTWLMSGRKILR